MADASPDPTTTVLPPPPEAVERIVPADRRGPLTQYAEMLSTAGIVRGLIGPREVPRLWDRHLLNCAALEALLPPSSTVVDLGSGAGLPGLVVAIVRPDLKVTLVEPLLRRTTFLDEVVAELGLDNVEVIRGRADALHGVRQFDVVTSRAVAPLPRLLAWSMPLVAPTGALIAMKGSSVAEEIAEASSDLEHWGCAEPTTTVLGEGDLEVPTVALRVAWADPARVSLPPAHSTQSSAASQTQRSRQKRSSGSSPRGKVGRERRTESGRNSSRRSGGHDA